MSEALLSLVTLVVICFTFLLGVTLVLVAMPNFQLKPFLSQCMGWMFVMACVIYTISPIDAIPEAITGPFGLFDDAGAIAAGLTVGLKTWKANRQRQLEEKVPINVE